MTNSPLGPAVTFQGVALGYDSRIVLDQVDGRIERGELLALFGPNGGGKSTFLRGIVGEAKRLQGRVDLITCGVRQVAYLPQGPEIDRSFPLTVAEFAAIGLWPSLGAWRRTGRAERRQVGGVLERVGLLGFESRLIGALSGGQLQRLLFARTLLQDAPVILLDEPFTAIDEATAADLMSLVQDWHRSGRTVVAALHDLQQVRAGFPRTLLLAGRPIAWGPTEEALSPENLARAGRGGERSDIFGGLARPLIKRAS